MEMVMFSTEPDVLLVEYITRNEEFVGLVECSEISFEDQRLVECSCGL